MPERRLDAVTVGEALGVFTPTPAGSLRPGSNATFTVGGAELNVAIGLARMGHAAGWVGSVGDDAVGRAVQSALRVESVDVSRVKVDQEAPTGLYIKESSGLDKVRVSYHRQGSTATRLDAIQTDLDYLLSGRILHLTGITPMLSASAAELVQVLFARAAARGVAVSFDANIRHQLLNGRQPRQLLGSFLAAADLLFLSVDECEALLGVREPAAVADEFARLRASVIVVHDAGGAYAVDAHGVTHIESRTVHVVDPVGAGDGFVAGYLSGYLRDWPVDECLRLAELCAAHVVTTDGDNEGLPREADAMAELGRAAARAER